LAGTILSGFLGTGWAWKLVELFKHSPIAPYPTPTPSPEPTLSPAKRSRRDDNAKGRR
jgi:hypothetical protein